MTVLTQSEPRVRRLKAHHKQCAGDGLFFRVTIPGDTMFVQKLVFLLFPCLLFFGNLFAQTDTTVPPAAQRTRDTSLAPVHHPTVRSDSAIRADSIARAIRRHRRDSLRRDSLRRDTATRHDTAATAVVTARPDSSMSAAQPPPAKDKGPEALVYWGHVLSIQPYYNFTGKHVQPPFQPHRPYSKDRFFYLLVGILFYFALVRISFEKYFNNLITLFFRVSLRQQQIREQVLQTPLPSLLLNILFIITGGLYACTLLYYSRFTSGINFWILYLDCIVGLAVIYLGKFLILKFCGWVFNISRATDTYIFVVFLVNKMLGIFLLPFLILITFLTPPARDIFITISVVMVFIMLIYRVVAAFRPIRNEIKLTPFYFFLYLCAFEIAPLLLIYKVLLSYLEKM